MGRTVLCRMLGGVAFLFAVSGATADSLGQVTFQHSNIVQGARPSNGDLPPTVLNGVPASPNFSTFDGQIGFTSSWDAEGKNGSFISQSHIDAATGTMKEVGFNVYFTVPDGATAIIAPAASTTPWVSGVMWIENIDTGEYYLDYSHEGGPMPVLHHVATNPAAGRWRIFGTTLAELDETGAGGARQMGVTISIVPEPATLAAIGLLAPVAMCRRRR